MQDKHIYVEKFWFRTRTHKIEEVGIRTIRNDFWVSSDTVTRYESLGFLVQYQSNAKLSDWFLIVVLFILGVKGLLMEPYDGSVFSICIILIAVSLYLLVGYLFNLTHVGSFYFSNSVQREGNFEIKSRYPASPELELFLEQVRHKQKENALKNLIAHVSADDNINDLTAQLKVLRSYYGVTDDEYAVTLQRLKNRLEELS